MMKIRSRNTGFTLIEVMIVVAIVSILASIAYPAYKDYVLRGYAADMTGALTDYKLRVEQYYANNRQYAATNGAACAVPAPTNSNYTIACTVGATTVQTYTATVTGTAGTGYAGFLYGIDQTGTKNTICLPVRWGGSATCTVASAPVPATGSWTIKKGG